MMLVFFPILLASGAEQCVNDCESAGLSLLTLKTSVSYRAAVELWTSNAEKSRIMKQAATESATIKDWSDENAALKRAVQEGMSDDKDDAAAPAQADSPLVASAVDAAVAKTVVAKNAHLSHEDANLAHMLKDDPTVIPGINDVAQAEGPKERAVASVKEEKMMTADEHQKETAEREEWINSLKEARDASRHLENTSELSKFIQAQQASNMACHAKQLEAKRTLDGLATKVMLLSDEIEGQESVIAGQNKMVKDMLEQGARSAESKKAEHHTCNVEYNKSWDGLQRYRDEIFELHNIAFPKHRSKIAHGGLDHHINYTSEAEQHAEHVRDYFQRSYQNDEWESQVDIEAIRDDHSKFGFFDPSKYGTHGQYAEEGMNGPDIYGAQDKAGRYMARGGRSQQYRHSRYALVEEEHSHHQIKIDDDNTLSDRDAAAEAFANKEVCKHLNSFLMKTAEAKRKADPNYITTEKFVQLDCNEQREALQKTFGEAYRALMKIVELGEAEAEENKQNCYGSAYAKDDQAQMSYQEKINKASAWIQAAKDVVTVTLPILENAKKEFGMLEDHIADLKENCVVDDNVTTHLKSVRRLIEQLDKCPGRNDFKLVIPGQKDTTGTPNPYSSVPES
jgi:hypothetical protein